MISTADRPTVTVASTRKKPRESSGSSFFSVGTPLSRVLVNLRINNFRPCPIDNLFGPTQDVRIGKVKTDEEGIFKIENIKPGTYQVELAHQNYPTLRVNDVEIRMDQESELPPQYMKKGATLQGRVFNDTNTPVVGATITIQKSDNTFHATVTSDMEGNYRITDMPPGTYKISPMPQIKENQNPLTLLPAITSWDEAMVKRMDEYLEQYLHI